MLKHRKEGLTTLHSIWMIVLISLLYFGFMGLLDRTGLIVLTEEANPLLYYLAVVGGMMIGLRFYHDWSQNLARLSWIETFHLTKQQVIRIALVVFLVVFATKDGAISRLFLGNFLLLATVALFVGNHYLPRLICRSVFKSAHMPTLVVGHSSALQGLTDWLSHNTCLGVETVGLLTKENPRKLNTSLAVLGTPDRLDEVIESRHIAQVIILKEGFTGEETRKLLQIAQQHGCRVRIFNNYEREFNHPILVDQEGPFTFFTLDNEPLENPLNRAAKRSLDVMVALPVVAFILPPLTLLVWFFQRREAPGPVFYRQPRSGLTQKKFQILKYRTMWVDNGDVTRQASREDDRIFSFGRFLRKTSLDEMPQFINVLLGDMSVAGPRPHLVEHDELFSQNLNSYYTRHFVKPGITGLAQCNGYRGEIVDPELLRKRVNYDIQYINRWSLMLDLQIIFMTFKQIFRPPNSAY